MVDRSLLNDTMQKINASLNKRFETDADLYISKQDEFEIKKNLCSRAYSAVVDMAKAKGISHTIVVKVLLRSAGVITVKDTEAFRKELGPVLQDADYGALRYMMENVLTRNVYMQKNVRHVLFSCYMGGIPVKERIQYWENEAVSLDAYERKRLFELILLEPRSADPAQTLRARINFMEKAFVKFPGILHRDAILQLKTALDDGEQTQFFGYLCNEMEAPFIESRAYDFALVTAYTSYGEAAFNDAVSHIKDSSPPRYKQYIKAIRNLFEKEQDKDTLVSMFDTIYRIYQSPYIKRHIQKQIGFKIWPTAKGDPVLYQERRVQLDMLLNEMEKSETNSYTSISDIINAMANGVPPKSVAYFWLNMPPAVFEKSLEASFTELSPGYLHTTNAVYAEIFAHGESKGGVRELKHLCDRIAVPLLRFAGSGKQSAFFDALDRCWLDNVMKYTLTGENTKKYMFAVHYDKVREWEK